MQGIFALALDIDLIVRSPVRKGHKPAVRRHEKPVWTPEEIRKILENSPKEHRAFFTTIADRRTPGGIACAAMEAMTVRSTIDLLCRLIAGFDIGQFGKRQSEQK
jgi:hypothetical protein